MDAKTLNAKTLIAKWPDRYALAADTGRSRITIDSWASRDSIPAEADVQIVKAARARRIRGVTYEKLAKMRAEET